VAFAGSEALVAAAEEKLGRRLPEPHRERLIRENGGEIRAAGEVWTLYPVWDPTDRKTMGRTASHIVRENGALRDDWPEMLPDGALAIADNAGGDLLVIVPGDDAIRSWDHETGEMSVATVRWG
jgi:SMI1/KNR4 family protein SUKH-1